MKIRPSDANLGQVDQWSFIFLVITLVPVAVIPFLGGIDDFFIEITFAILAFQSALLMVFVSGVFGKIYYLFSYFFFSITPWIQFKNSIVFWGFPRVLDNIFFEINLILIILNFLFLFSYLAGIRSRNKTPLTNSIEFLITKHQYKFLVLIVYLSGLIIFSLANFNSENLFFRTGGADRLEVNQITGLLLIPVYFLPFICVAYYLVSTKKTIFKVLILILPMVLVLFPTGLPRNFTALIYLTLLLITFPGLRAGNRLPFFLFIGLIFVFPLLENFRSYDANEYEFLPAYDFFLAPHFDSYQSFAIAYQHKIITFGYQLLGPLLFFIPRVCWESKPTGSGHFVANIFELPFTNISSNIYAEAYINFGLIGCIVFSIALGFFGGKFSYQIASNQESIPKKIVLYGAAAYFIYFLRGDLMSPTAYFLGFVFCVFFIWFFLQLINSPKKI